MYAVHRNEYVTLQQSNRKKMFSVLSVPRVYITRTLRAEGKTQAIYNSARLGVPEDVLQLKERYIPSINNVSYLGVTFDMRMA